MTDGDGESTLSRNLAAELMAEKLSHTIDLMRAEISTLRAEQGHQRELFDHRLRQLEDAARDHEQRLRGNTEGVTQFRQWAGLASGGSAIMSLAALIKAFFVP